jgi:hypothetical protein
VPARGSPASIWAVDWGAGFGVPPDGDEADEAALDDGADGGAASCPAATPAAPSATLSTDHTSQPRSGREDGIMKAPF